LLGIEIVPVEAVGAGLTPGDAISVAPNGMPVGDTAEFVVVPSGEVAPSVGVGLAVPPTCAMATLLTTNAGRTAAINESLTSAIRLPSALPQRLSVSGFVKIPFGSRLSYIDSIPPWCKWSLGISGSGRYSNYCRAGHAISVVFPVERPRAACSGLAPILLQTAAVGQMMAGSRELFN
jgi:hypothetical protein